MAQGTEKRDLLLFIEWAADMNKVNAHTASGWKVACSKLLSSVDDNYFVTDGGIAQLAKEFIQNGFEEVTTATVSQYERRAKQALSQCLIAKVSPDNYIFSGGKMSAAAALEYLKERPLAFHTKVADFMGQSDDAALRAYAESNRASTYVRKALSERPSTAETIGPTISALHRLANSDPTTMTVPFPIRTNCQAELLLPRNITQAEADRLCHFIQLLVVPQ